MKFSVCLATGYEGLVYPIPFCAPEDLIKTGVVIIGSPNTVREKLAEYQDLAGFNTSLTKTQFGTLPDDMTRANMQAIAQEILPAFRDRLPQGQQRAAAE